VAIKVRVRNFQSIVDAEIEIDGLTVMTGTNNAGKSAFFRAIRGAVTNARGYDFVRNNETHCQVDIIFPEGKTLTWKKGKGINTYIINGKEYPKVNVGVPPEAQIFGIDSVTAGKTELWPQIAPAITGVSFLLHETGSVIAEAVADVARVNQLSRALKACESDRRSAKSQLKIRRADSKILAERREGFIGLDETVEEILALEGKVKQADKIIRAVNNVEKLQRRYKDAAGAVTALEGLDDAEKALPESKRVTTARAASEALTAASKLRHRWVGAQKSVASMAGLETVEDELPSEQRMQYAKNFRKAVGLTVELAIRYEEAQEDLAQAEQAQATLEEIDLNDTLIVKTGKFQKALSNANSLKIRYVKNRDAVAELEQQIRDQQAILDDLIEQTTSVLGTYEECPTCGGGLDHVH